MLHFHNLYNFLYDRGIFTGNIMLTPQICFKIPKLNWLFNIFSHSEPVSYEHSLGLRHKCSATPVKEFMVLLFFAIFLDKNFDQEEKAKEKEAKRTDKKLMDLEHVGMREKYRVVQDAKGKGHFEKMWVNDPLGPHSSRSQKVADALKARTEALDLQKNIDARKQQVEQATIDSKDFLKQIQANTKELARLKSLLSVGGSESGDGGDGGGG